MTLKYRATVPLPVPTPAASQSIQQTGGLNTASNQHHTMLANHIHEI